MFDVLSREIVDDLQRETFVMSKCSFVSHTGYLKEVMVKGQYIQLVIEWKGAVAKTKI